MSSRRPHWLRRRRKRQAAKRLARRLKAMPAAQCLLVLTLIAQESDHV